MYHVVLTEGAKKEIKNMDRPTALLILAWIRKNLEGCENPRLHGKALKGNLDSRWSYRVGDYRLLAEIQDSKITLLIVSIGHRREVYKS
ncbi:cytotoxic translational repressor of toxin-antitoxin stability system [Desulfitobacterium dichloroeliminans LMG P-21439]|uniref:Cytotoxic translational repressor of toxin-antitoxin stability system n=1 Tax=Desulfitobacterium dichloroeliminans (strain LMG P-21439 / DCA1) TaxID=871963 RepID=L0F9Y3_DESDL|nr:type II toxin-antitoxin system RelE/ParE family toxin [Desulfitobacterium dichloroeliminans]AGA70619.1 cytotoxic translational repressor of toxin-antitoxin stability system [Desulfitobacterium dichloroeliminans LMG P-21439]